MMKVKVRVEPTEEIRVRVAGQIYAVGDYKHYEGKYEVKPSFEKQKLNTKNKVMDDDVTVKEIPVTVVSNSSGGNTVIIG